MTVVAELLEVTVTLRTATGYVMFTEQQPGVSSWGDDRLAAAREPVINRGGSEMINKVAAAARAWIRAQS